MQITTEDWANLTEKEKEILKAIGIKPTCKPKSPTVKISKIKLPEEYILEVKTHCQLCRINMVSYFKMAPNKTKTCLISIPIKERETLNKKVKSKDIQVRTCKNCLNRIINQDKIILAKKLMRLYSITSAEV